MEFILGKLEKYCLPVSVVISNSSCSFLIYFSAVSLSFLNRAVTWEIWSISNGTTWREGQRIGLEINVTMYKKYKTRSKLLV